MELKYPGWHSEQTPTPGTLLARPGGHAWHELNEEPPSVGLKRPGGLGQKNQREMSTCKEALDECPSN